MSFFNGDIKSSEISVEGETGLVLKDLGGVATTPSSGYGALYVNADVLYFKTDGGTATNLLSGGGGGGGASTSSINTFTETQSITKNKDGDLAALKIRNSNSANGTNAIVSMRFDFSDSSGAKVESGKIAVKKNQEFLSVSDDLTNNLTQDSNMVFSTCLNGTLTEQLTLDSNGVLYNIKGNKGSSSYVGSGFGNTNSNGSSICNFFINKMGAEIISTILIDISSLSSTSSGDKIIGNGSSSYFFQITPSEYNLIYKIEFTCLEGPGGAAGQYPTSSIGIHYNTSTLASGDSVSSQTIIFALMQSPGTISTSDTTISIASTTKLYLYGSSGDTAEYNAGQFLVKIYGCSTP